MVWVYGGRHVWSASFRRPVIGQFGMVLAGRLFESALALLLGKHGVATDYEQRAGRMRMDMVADVDGLRIVLEAERGFN